MKIYKIYLLICFLIFSVNHTALAQSVNKPATDFSTPAAALKSYWVINEWLRANRAEIVQKYESELFNIERDSLMFVTTGNTRKYFETFNKMPNEVFDRTILEITVENSTQAVIRTLIKNVTPIPPQAVPTSRQIEARIKGREFIYTLVKEAGEWKVSEVLMGSDEVRSTSQQLYQSTAPLYPYGVYFD